jgi:hypothetical protein
VSFVPDAECLARAGERLVAQLRVHVHRGARHASEMPVPALGEMGDHPIDDLDVVVGERREPRRVFGSRERDGRQPQFRERVQTPVGGRQVGDDDTPHACLVVPARVHAHLVVERRHDLHEQSVPAGRESLLSTRDEPLPEGFHGHAPARLVQTQADGCLDVGAMQ